MIHFILNERLIRTEQPGGLSLLDFIRYEQGLRGTKVGCREGDCGACLVLKGRLIAGQMRYRSIVSCLTPLANVHGQHIVTVEGINGKALSPVQAAIAECGATQCGFCTPGFVMALTGLCLSEEAVDSEQAIAALDGNLCRCTGYQSLREAALFVAGQLPALPEDRPVSLLAEKGFVPGYFAQIPEKLAAIPPAKRYPRPGRIPITGGTDLYVQAPDALLDTLPNFLAGTTTLEKISFHKGLCTIGSAVTATDIARNPVLLQYFPRIRSYFNLIASTPIRNMGAIGGNIANASPIADMAIFFLALDAELLLRSPCGRRELPMSRFFLGYKQLDKGPDEYIEAIRFALPGPRTRFHFEKVSKRTYLDIASVNTAVCIEMDGDTVARIRLSAGGVAPIPLFLTETCRFFQGKSLSTALLSEANEVMQQEISPISDIRGAAAYKRLLLRQLLYAHFGELFPDRGLLPQQMTL